MNNKLIYLLLVLGLSVMGNVAHANDSEINLKRSCIKANPLVDGESDPSLLSIYAQICDKKNTENKLLLLTQAANRFQQLDKPLKSLMLIDFLEKQNVNMPELTDAKFLLGVNIAKSSLKKMRENESRHLSLDKTYPPVKAFVDLYHMSLPSEEMVKQNNNDKLKASGTLNSHRNSERVNKSGTKGNHTKARTQQPAKQQTQRPVVTPTPTTTKSTNKTPFSGF